MIGRIRHATKLVSSLALFLRIIRTKKVDNPIVFDTGAHRSTDVELSTYEIETREILAGISLVYGTRGEIGSYRPLLYEYQNRLPSYSMSRLRLENDLWAEEAVLLDVEENLRESRFGESIRLVEPEEIKQEREERELAEGRAKELLFEYLSDEQKAQAEKGFVIEQGRLGTYHIPLGRAWVRFEVSADQEMPPEFNEFYEEVLARGGDADMPSPKSCKLCFMNMGLTENAPWADVVITLLFHIQAGIEEELWKKAGIFQDYGRQNNTSPDNAYHTADSPVVGRIIPVNHYMPYYNHPYALLLPPLVQ